MEEEFWMWVSSWALFATKPSDLNPSYSDDGYDLPPLEVRWHELPVHYGDTADRDGQMQLFQEAAEGLKEAAAVKRESIQHRAQQIVQALQQLLQVQKQIMQSLLQMGKIQLIIRLLSLQVEPIRSMITGLTQMMDIGCITGMDPSGWLQNMVPVLLQPVQSLQKK